MSNLRHFVTTGDLTPDEMLKVFRMAATLKEAARSGFRSTQWRQFSDLLRKYTVANLFYEPSTRTRFSFETAVLHLGGNRLTTEAAGIFSSAAKGESLPDTMRMLAGYGVDVAVLRHTDKGGADIAAKCNAIAVINAGDGDGQHPTQALLDWFTIWERFQNRRGVRLLIVGDLKHGRTVHSLIDMICELRDTELGMVSNVRLVSPVSLGLPKRYLNKLNRAGITHSAGTKLRCNSLTSQGVVYVTRPQRERMASGEDPGTYVIRPEMVKGMRKTAMVLHPLPRTDELPLSIDKLVQAKYFEQAENGMFIRMALLLWMFGKLDKVLR